MNWEDRLNIISHTVNFFIVIYILKSAFQTNTFELSHPLLTIFALIISVFLNIIGVFIVLKKHRRI